MKKLEGYKGFSVVAWTIVVLFSLFTYYLVLDLQKTLGDISESLAERQVTELKSN